MNNFYEQAGYALPDDMPQSVASEQKQYYRHPAGIYNGFIGRLMLKYKTADGKWSEQGMPGAILVRGVLQTWIKKYLGTPQTPVNVTILNDDLTFSPDRKIAELYYPQVIEFAPKDQWKNIKLFDTFTLGSPESKIIRSNADKPTIKETVFKNFAYYYGVPVKWVISLSDIGNTYIDTKKDRIEIIKGAERIPIADIAALEKEFERQLEAERAARKTEQAPEYTPPTADIDLSGINPDLLNDNTDLPF